MTRPQKKDTWLQVPDSRTFFSQLIDLGADGAWSPEDMLTLMAGESSLIPTARNPSGAEGLTQLMPATLKNLGWDTVAMGAFHKATPEVQLEYTAAYFREWRRRMKVERWTSAGHLWACNLAPAYLGRDVLYSELDHPAQYRANRWLDHDGDRKIERHELDLGLQHAVRACQARFDLALAGLAHVRREREAGACLEPPTERIQT